jgi:hypothetical protein
MSEIISHSPIDGRELGRVTLASADDYEKSHSPRV